MATARKKSKRIHSPKGIGCFVTVFSPKARVGKDGKPKGEPKYSILMYFKKKPQSLIDEVERVAVEKWGEGAIKKLKTGKLHNPIKDDLEDLAEKHGEPFNKEGWVVSFKSGDQPGIVDEEGEPITSKRDFYSGVECRVSARCYAFENESSGVSFALVNIQKLGDGKRLAGNPSAEDDFSGGDDNDDDDDKPARRRSKRDDDDDDDGV